MRRWACRGWAASPTNRWFEIQQVGIAEIPMDTVKRKRKNNPIERAI
jgi:hypothetical protein